MKKIKDILEGNDYFKGCTIENVLTNFQENSLVIHILKNDFIVRTVEGNIPGIFKMKFPLINSFGWDNSKFNQLSKNILPSHKIDHIIVKEGTEEYNQIKFFLTDNRILTVSFEGFLWE